MYIYKWLTYENTLGRPPVCRSIHIYIYIYIYIYMCYTYTWYSLSLVLLLLLFIFIMSLVLLLLITTIMYYVSDVSCIMCYVLCTTYHVSLFSFLFFFSRTLARKTSEVSRSDPYPYISPSAHGPVASSHNIALLIIIMIIIMCKGDLLSSDLLAGHAVHRILRAVLLHYMILYYVIAYYIISCYMIV